jgi:hypothetical protein
MIVRSVLLGLSWGMFSLVPLASQNLPPQFLPILGGTNGHGFTRSCGAGRVLAGLVFRDGSLVDAVGIICRPVLANGTLGPASTVGSLVGGGGGTAGSETCAPGRAVTRAGIRHGSYVNSILLFCRTWNAGTRTVSGNELALNFIGHPGGGTLDFEGCESNRQPGNGIRGRAAGLVDAIGFICDEP